MIQSILFFVLGFLSAGFLALLVAPAIWRRAVALTRRRIEASVPLSLTEIQADKDRIRAEHAMSTRRLEMKVRTFREKATELDVEINRNREELKRISAERDERDHAISQLETGNGELRNEMKLGEEQMQRLSEALAEREKLLEARAAELEKMGRMYEDASFEASNRQIELVARETQIDKLNGDISILRGKQKESDRKALEMTQENDAAREGLESEKKRSADLEQKVERLMATLADHEDKLDRRERELARLREQIRGTARSEGDLEAQLGEVRSEKAQLETEVADLTRRVSTLLTWATDGDGEKAATKVSEDRGRLESRLTVLTRENKKLRSEISAYKQAKSEAAGEERNENVLLREQINDLAAEVIQMTAALEGPKSPIHAALSTPVRRAPTDAHAKIASLAERVKALQKVGSAG